MNLPPVGKHRTAPLRMFQAVAANKVRQNRYAVEDTRVWREQCLNPMTDAAFSGSCILADEIPTSVESSFPELCRETDGMGPLSTLADRTPCWRPPFDRLWVEMRLDQITEATSRAWEATYTTKKSGKTFRCVAVGGFFRTAEVRSPSEVAEDFPDCVTEPGGPEAVRWVVEYDVWAMLPDGVVVGPGVSGTYFVGADGNKAAGMNPVLRTYDQSGKHDPVNSDLDLATVTREQVVAEHERLVRIVGGLDRMAEETAACMACVATQYLLGYAIGLMGCKNITTPVASDGDRRANPGLPRSGVRYRILKVAPLARRRGSSMSDDAGEALPLALHGVRGHFADYRDGRGLFGKHRGLYYISPHLRGKAEAGEVVKDYSVAGAPTQ